jgi:hypothetical protein
MGYICNAMKKICALFLILSHMNTSMFLPQVPEEDVYDANGQQIDDITSVVEWVATAMGYDHTADDENDDSGQNFHIVKSCDYSYQPTYTLVEQELPATTNKKSTVTRSGPCIENISLDILTPPPKA